MNQPVSNTPTPDLSPEQLVVLQALRDAQRRGDATAVATWMAAAADLNLPTSVLE